MTDPRLSPHRSEPGGHGLPPRFSDIEHGPASIGSRPRRRPSRRARSWVLLSAGLLIAVVAAGIVQVTASTGYDQARAAFEEIAAEDRTASDELRRSAEEATASARAADEIIAASSGSIIRAEDVTAVGAASALVDEAASASTADATSPVPEAGVKPLFAWDLHAESDRLRTDAAAMEERRGTLAAAHDRLDDASAALVAAGSATLRSAASLVPALEQQFPSARTGDLLALREAGTALESSAGAMNKSAVNAYSAFEASAAQVRASNDAELAEKAGPLQSVRLEVEAYARSIAGGILLDFDWAPLVNGYGGADSIGGLTSWNSGTGSGGFATITLSDSVAEFWPEDSARALVTHEVGHAISAKCWALFDWEDRAANETWATAWAISHGETADANGVWLYGYPPQAVIDTAATCR
ncbi:hypothetical protein J2Y69_002468 [Microbacterium resistens]|uniref:Uncharacterized protein n=1 Tax=Microbacterium resistens TaxID=156977 RepID=A0ABU1SE16_9MICO|nr:hypothetical protein [Microbacterium resistens]MDR6867860.1 hypothetical protein [Microbacterium resistens]